MEPVGTEWAANPGGAGAGKNIFFQMVAAMKLPLSVAIVAQNEQDRLPDCVRGAGFADEVVVVDSGSRDATVRIAAEMGCRVIRQSWQGFARQKQFAVDRCRNDWVLILDADERVPAETAEALAEIFGNSPPAGDVAGFVFPRRNFFHGRWFRHCGWWPDRVLRLVDRRRGKFSDNRVHERWMTDGPIRELDVLLDHHSFRDYAELIDKMQRYSTLAAHEMVEKGRRSHWWSPISHGGWTFFRDYLLKTGFLGGFDGFTIALLNASGSFMKYAKLREAKKFGKERIGL